MEAADATAPSPEGVPPAAAQATSRHVEGAFRLRDAADALTPLRRALGRRLPAATADDEEPKAVRLAGPVRPVVARLGAHVLADVARQPPTKAAETTQVEAPTKVQLRVDGPGPARPAAGPVVPTERLRELALANTAGLALLGPSTSDLRPPTRTAARLAADAHLGPGQLRSAKRQTGTANAFGARPPVALRPAPIVVETEAIRPALEQRRP